MEETTLLVPEGITPDLLYYLVKEYCPEKYGGLFCLCKSYNPLYPKEESFDKLLSYLGWKIEYKEGIFYSANPLGKESSVKDNQSSFVDFLNSPRVWKLNGELHRNKGPAFIDKDTERYYRYGKLHRDSGFCVNYKKPSLSLRPYEKYIEGRKVFYWKEIVYKLYFSTLSFIMNPYMTQNKRRNFFYVIKTRYGEFDLGYFLANTITTLVYIVKSKCVWSRMIFPIFMHSIIYFGDRYLPSPSGRDYSLW